MNGSGASLTKNPIILLFSIYLTLYIGLRHSVGVDWASYVDHIEHAKDVDLCDSLGFHDPAYFFLTWISAYLTGEIYLANLVVASIFVWGLLRFCTAQPRPFISLIVAVPYLIIVVSMGYPRQATAISLVMVGLLALQDSKYHKFIVYVVLAALFHKSALVMGVLLPLTLQVGNIARLLMLALPVVIVSLFFQESLILIDVSYRYIEQDLSSSGAFVRLLMNVVPVILFLPFSKEYGGGEAFIRTWRALSVFSLVLFLALLFGAPSTLIDRFALYAIPLQLMVYGRLVEVLGRRIGKTFVKVLIIVLCFSTQFVWFFFGEFSYAWIPYKSYLLLNL